MKSPESEQSSDQENERGQEIEEKETPTFIVRPERFRAANRIADEKAKEEELARLKNEMLDPKDISGEKNNGAEQPSIGQNRFAEYQEALLTPGDRFMEKIIGAGGNVHRKIRNFFQPLKFRENPDKARRTRDQYEGLVREGKAEYAGQNSGVSYLDYKEMKRAYKKRSSSRNQNYYSRAVGIYDKRDKFTGNVQIYRIKK